MGGAGMRYRLYQTSWNGTSLVDIAIKKGIDCREIAKKDIYDEFYRAMIEGGWVFDRQWIESKARISEILREKVVATAITNPKILSVGAGTGIVEEHLLRNGYDVTLQDCQSKSFEYLRRKGVEFKSIISQDFADIPSNSFDIVFIGTVSYALDDDQYQSFINDTRRICRPGGVVLFWEVGFNLIPVIRRLAKNGTDFIFKCFDKGYARHELFWGWIRSSDEHRHVFEHAGFKLVEQSFYNEHWHHCFRFYPGAKIWLCYRNPPCS